MGIHVGCDGEVLDVVIDGAEQFFGLRKHIEVPVVRILDVRVDSAKDARSDLVLRTGGTWIPRRVTLGHFRGRRAKKQWWRVYRAAEVLVIDLSEKSAFDRIVLEVPEPMAMADLITDRCPHLPAEGEHTDSP